MGDADAFAAFAAMVLVAEGDNTMPVFKPDRARSPEARRVEAQEFVEENAAVRVASAFRHELKATARPAWRYPDTTYECQSIETPQGWGGLRAVRRARLSVANRRRADTPDGNGGRHLGEPLTQPSWRRPGFAQKPPIPAHI